MWCMTTGTAVVKTLTVHTAWVLCTMKSTGERSKTLWVLMRNR